ncbi:hypothetical protein PanWU01x14_237160 [Parasponia andersonii]|uniref:Uncharacterized protein n=1 Tax=Parasponia andersonii TaxID=3476 RepID=A0A2P5BI34_PARAD|nr:hypothetical protein PanWU01x14_237160 [Parasponia andersonii]
MGIVLREPLHMPTWRFRPRCHWRWLPMAELRRSMGGSRAIVSGRHRLGHNKGVDSKGRRARVRGKENLGRF